MRICLDGTFSHVVTQNYTKFYVAQTINYEFYVAQTINYLQTIKEVTD